MTKSAHAAPGRRPSDTWWDAKCTAVTVTVLGFLAALVVSWFGVLTYEGRPTAPLLALLVKIGIGIGWLVPVVQQWLSRKQTARTERAAGTAAAILTRATSSVPAPAAPSSAETGA